MPYYSRKSKQTYHIDWAENSDVMQVMWRLTEREDKGISFPPPPSLSDKYAEPFLCNSPQNRHHFHSYRAAKLCFYMCFLCLKLLRPRNPCYFLWSSVHYRGNRWPCWAVSNSSLLSGQRGLEAVVAAPMAGALPGTLLLFQAGL